MGQIHRRLSAPAKALLQRLNEETLSPSTRIVTSRDLDSVRSVASRVTARQFRQQATVAQIDAGSWEPGDTVLVTDAGTPAAAGSAACTAGDIAEYTGAAWAVILQAVGGLVPAGTRLLVSREALSTPMTDGTHENYIAEFGGITNTPVLVAPADGLMCVVKGEASVYENCLYAFDTSLGWLMIAGTAQFSANPEVTADVTFGFQVGSRWIHTTTKEEWICAGNSAGAASWRSQGYGVELVLAAAADQLDNIAATTDVPHATTFTFPSSPAPGTRVEVRALTKVISANAAEEYAPKVFLDTVPLTTLASYNATAADVVRLYAEFIIAGASTIHILDGYANIQGGTPTNGVTVPALDVAATLNDTPSVSVTSRWSAQHADDTVDLRQFSVRCWSPNVG